jgi:DNA-directed RNA polymerase specialized sigma subunit
MRKLLDTAKPILSKALVSYAGNDKSLTSQAKRLAVKAFKSFDPSRGTKLRTHLYIQLQPLQRERMKRTSPVSIPERVQFEQYKLKQAENEFREVRGREASDGELSEKLGLSPKRIAHVRAFANGTLSEGQVVQPSTGAKLPGTEEVNAQDIWIEYVHHDLDPLDKKILEWKTGLYGKAILSTNEIARRLKITPGAVSQRASKIALKIEEGSGGA